MEEGVLNRTREYKSYLGRFAWISVLWTILDYCVIPFAIIGMAKLLGLGNANEGSDPISIPFLTWFQFPLFFPFLACGLLAGLFTTFARASRHIAAFYASSIEKFVARWSGLILAGVVATGILTSLFPLLNAPFPVSPVTDLPFAFALLIAAFQSNFKRKVADNSDDEARRPTTRLKNVCKLQEKLVLRTSKRIWFVLLGYLFISVGTFKFRFITELLNLSTSKRFIFPSHVYLIIVLLVLFIVSAVRATLQRRSPNAILYRGESWIYLCCFIAVASIVSVYMPLLGAFIEIAPK